MEELQEEISRLHSIREDERMINRILSEMQQLEKPQTPKSLEKKAVSTPSIKVRVTSGEGEQWKLVTSGTKSELIYMQTLSMLLELYMHMVQYGKKEDFRLHKVLWFNPS